MGSSGACKSCSIRDTHMFNLFRRSTGLSFQQQVRTAPRHGTLEATQANRLSRRAVRAPGQQACIQPTSHSHHQSASGSGCKGRGGERAGHAMSVPCARVQSNQGTSTTGVRMTTTVTMPTLIPTPNPESAQEPPTAPVQVVQPTDRVQRHVAAARIPPKRPLPGGLVGLREPGEQVTPLHQLLKGDQRNRGEEVLGLQTGGRGPQGTVNAQLRALIAPACIHMPVLISLFALHRLLQRMPQFRSAAAGPQQSSGSCC